MPPATPAFRLPSCPPSPKGKDIPPPLPLRGRGSPRLFHARGFAPGTPALNRLRHVQTVPNRYPETEPGRRHSQGTASCRFAANRGFSPGNARGEAPCIRKLKISPFPAGEGGWGDRGQEIKLKAGAADNPNRRAPSPLLTEKPTPQPAESPTPKNKEIQYVGK